jgi:hypothetical protein
VLAVGIGGGGDVVGALATADLARSAGLGAAVGGVSWERRVIDPRPGPRRLDELSGLAERLGEFAALAGPDTTGPGPFHFAESHMARFLGEPVALIDPHGGPAGAAMGLAAAAERLGCDMVALVDVGGDVLGHGDEPGLASPLCDAVLLAASRFLELPCVGVVFGPGCDGELTLAEVLERVGEVAAAGGLLGAWGLTPAETERLEAAVAEVPTEASAQALRCARGEVGTGAIRGGRRSVELSPVGAVSFYFAPEAAIRSAARLADAVTHAGSLEAAEEILAERGVRSELAFERRVYAGQVSNTPQGGRSPSS